AKSSDICGDFMMLVPFGCAHQMITRHDYKRRDSRETASKTPRNNIRQYMSYKIDRYCARLNMVFPKS
ncbi:MAG: hypothetical protein ACJ8JD_10315, partial [Chthoniobacterales bacterium]